MIFIVSGIFYQHLERKWCMHTRTNTSESDPNANWIILPLNCSKIFSRLQEIFFLHLDYISIIIREINAYTPTHTSESALKLNYFTSKMLKKLLFYSDMLSNWDSKKAKTSLYNTLYKLNRFIERLIERHFVQLGLQNHREVAL